DLLSLAMLLALRPYSSLYTLSLTTLFRSPAQGVLQVERDDGLETEVGAEDGQGGEVGPHDRADLEDAQPHQRVADAILHHEERAEQSDSEDAGRDDGGGEAGLRRGDDGVDRREHAAGQQDGAGEIDAAFLLLAGARHHEPGGDEH